MFSLNHVKGMLHGLCLVFSTHDVICSGNGGVGALVVGYLKNYRVSNSCLQILQFFRQVAENIFFQFFIRLPCHLAHFSNDVKHCQICAALVVDDVSDVLFYIRFCFGIVYFLCLGLKRRTLDR